VPAGVDRFSKAAFSVKKLFRMEGGAPNASCCNRSSLSEITGNSSVTMQMSPNSAVQRADLGYEELRSQWMNAATARRAQIQLSAWLTRLSL